jgi:hypothetical protein
MTTRAKQLATAGNSEVTNTAYLGAFCNSEKPPQTDLS